MSKSFLVAFFKSQYELPWHFYLSASVTWPFIAILIIVMIINSGWSLKYDSESTGWKEGPIKLASAWSEPYIP